MNRRAAMFAVVVLLSFTVYGQDSTTARSVPDGFSGSAHFSTPSPYGMNAVMHAAYSAEEVNETVQTLSDGTHITRTMPVTKIYRDSSGRIRTERPLFRGMMRSGANMPEPPLVIEIMDPIAHARYTLDTINKVAHRQEFQAPAARVMNAAVKNARAAIPANSANAIQPQSTSEKLANQTIEGVPVEGTRRTTTFPVGFDGNDRAIVATTETWMSPDLKVMILSKTSDPRIGEQTQKLTHISRSEPDPGLFQPPGDYTVVDEKGDFTIKWGSAQQ